MFYKEAMKRYGTVTDPGGGVRWVRMNPLITNCTKNKALAVKGFQISTRHLEGLLLGNTDY